MINFQISSISQNYYTTSRVAKNNDTSKEDFKLDDNNSIDKTKEKGDVKKELREKYDIRDATYEEMCEVSRQLLNAGEITLLQHMKMTMDHSRLPGVKPNSPLAQMFNGERNDWINIFKERANQQLSWDNTDGYNSYINIKNILEDTFK